MDSIPPGQDSPPLGAPLSPKDRAWIDQVVRDLQEGRRVEEGFELLFREYLPICRRFFIHQGMIQEAEDLAQEVMVRMFKGIEGFRAKSSFDTWVVRITTNVFKNALRHRHTVKMKAESQSLEALLKPSGEGTPTIEEPTDPAEDPFDLAMARERHETLNRALDQLPQKMRQCVLLSYQGYSYREIADAQEISIATVKKHLIEGRRRLKPILGGFVELFTAVLFLRIF